MLTYRALSAKAELVKSRIAPGASGHLTGNPIEVGMLKTSFGEMEILLKDSGRPKIEYLKFISKGRPHRHAEFESFVTLKGSGKVMVGDQVFPVKPGDLVTIPPASPHWMEPDPGIGLEGLLWYHEEPLHTVG